MAGNFLITPDDEKRINAILENGIYEIRNNTGQTRKEKEKERMTEHILKSSIVNIDNSNLNILSTKITNMNCEEKNKREYPRSLNKIDNLHSLNYNYDNYGRNNVNLSTNSDDDKFNDVKINCILNKENVKVNTISSNINKNVASNPKSSALRNLLNEMKQNNKYLSSSEDECRYYNKFRGFVQQTQQIEEFQQSPQQKSKDQIDKTTNNILDTCADQELREIVPIKENTKISEKFRTECSITENSILLKESGIRLNSPDLMKTNTLTSDISYANDKELINLPSRFTKSIDTQRTEDENFSQLTDMHSEIKHLQNKMDGLEKKLKSSVNSNSFSNNIANKSTNKHLCENYDKKTSINRNNKHLGTSKRYKNYVSDDEVNYKSNKTKFTTFALGSINKKQYNSKNSSVNKENILKRSYSSNSDKYNLAGRKLKMKNLISGVVKSKLDYKEKFEKIKDNYDSIKATQVKERQLINHLTSRNKKLMRKEENYDKIYKSHHELKEEHMKLLKKYEESELIRKEQSKLIKSMIREIELLRGQFDENVNNNPDKIIEENKEMKNGLIKEKSKEAGKLQCKTRKKSKSKTNSSKNPVGPKKYLY